MSGARETQGLDYDPHCRGCGVPLMPENARVSRGRFVGACRPCEVTEARKRAGSIRYYTDSRRKYPIPEVDSDG